MKEITAEDNVKHINLNYATPGKIQSQDQTPN